MKYSRIVYTTSIALSIIGVIFIYSASSYNAVLQTGDAFFYVKKQIIALFLGIFVMFAVKIVNIENLKKYKYRLLFLGYILLSSVFIPGIGVESYGAKRWINLKITTIQPSEYAKFFLVVFMASFCAEKNINDTKNLIKLLILAFFMCILIILEPNMSITLCVGAVIFIMLYICGLNKKKLALLSLPVIATIPLLIVLEPYRMKRLIAFINPWENPKSEGYQLIQSYYALGNGGLFGVGLFNSRQKYMFLPFSESDFILSIIGEETGLFGVIVLALIFIVLIFSGIKISINAESRFKSYLAGGITAVIAVQTIMNFAVVSGSIPPTGLPLPFISAGGSSLVAFLLFSGILASCESKRARVVFEA